MPIYILQWSIKRTIEILTHLFSRQRRRCLINGTAEYMEHMRVILQSRLIIVKLTLVSWFTIRSHKSRLYTDDSYRAAEVETVLDNEQNFVPQSIGNHKDMPPPPITGLPYQNNPLRGRGRVTEGHGGFGSLLFASQQELGAR